MSFPEYVGSSLRRTTYTTFNQITWFQYASSVTTNCSYITFMYLQSLSLNVQGGLLDPTWWVCHGNGGESFVLKPFYSTTSLNNCVGVYACPSSHYTLNTFPYMSTLGPQSENWRPCLTRSDMKASDKTSWYRGRLSMGNFEGHTPWVLVLVWVPHEPCRDSLRIH